MTSDKTCLPSNCFFHTGDLLFSSGYQEFLSFLWVYPVQDFLSFLNPYISICCQILEVFSNYFFKYFSVSSPGSPSNLSFRSSIVNPWLPETLFLSFFFFCLFCIHCSNWVISSVLISNSLTLSSILSRAHLLLSLYTALFGLVILFLSSPLSIWFFFLSFLSFVSQFYWNIIDL